MIPGNLKFVSKIESVAARRFLTQIQPIGGSSTYVPGDTITVQIPTSNNTCLIPSESYLKGNLNLSCGTADATAATFESAGIHGFIQRIRLFHGSNLLEDCDQYSQMAKLLYDYQAPDDVIKGRFAVTSATNPQYNVTSGTIVRGVNRGATTAVTFPAATVVPFAINLISLVGSLCGDKYLPLFSMSAAPLRIEIVLKPSLVTSLMLLQGSAVSPTFSFTGVNYCAEILELPSGAVSAIIAGSSSPMQMVVPSMRTYTNSAAITTAGTQVSQNIPAKFSSLKSIVVATRSSQGASGLYPNSHCKFGLTSYNFRIGAEILPSTAPTTSAEFFSEVLKCYGSLADLSLQPSIDLISYDLSGNNTVTTSGEASLFDSGSFAVGIDTEVFSNVSKASIFNGTNTNNSDIFFIANYTPNANTTILQTAVATFDQVLVFENGVCYARY